MLKKIKKIDFVIILGILFFLLVILIPESVLAQCVGHNVRGWAYSENIGWISFSCENNVALGTGIDYGVDINSVSGLFSGYAWSENIGWISFESGDLTECPSGTCQASIDLETGLVSGWARALAHGGGWDGWIGLSGTWADGVSLNSGVGPPSEFEGWAWGDVVVGWVSFNDKDFDGSPGPVDYQVVTDIVLNSPPTAINLDIVEGNYCGCAIGQVTQCSGSKSSPPIYLNWTFDDSGDSQSAYQIEIHRNSSYTSLEIDSGEVSTSGPGPNYSYVPLGLNFNTSYWWRLKVWDSRDVVSDDWIYPVSSFTTDVRWPNTKFTPDLLDPPAEVEVTFMDESKCYTSVGVEYDCKDGAGVSYSWDFGDGNTSEDKEDITHSYAVSGDYIVRLEVTGSMCPCVFPLTATLPLPVWKEIVPF